MIGPEKSEAHESKIKKIINIIYLTTLIYAYIHYVTKKTNIFTVIVNQPGRLLNYLIGFHKVHCQSLARILTFYLNRVKETSLRESFFF